jgi:LEA14-like dessication related protein
MMSFRGRLPTTHRRLRNLRCLPVLCLLPGLACTPLGLWLYEDPQVTVDRVRVDVDGLSTRPVVVALAVNNPNDYALSATRLEFRLVLDDLPIGGLDRKGSMSVPKGVATMALPIETDRTTTPARLQAFNSGVHRFAIEGRATFTTPIGKRKVRFAQQGELAFGLPPSPASAPADPGASP